MKALDIAIMQANPLMGAIAQNRNTLLETFYHTKADILITPECFLSGYPPEDLVLRSEFMDTIHEEINNIRNATVGRKTAILLGTPYRVENGDIYNAALFIYNGHIEVRFKHHRPNYGPFDEKRVFQYAPIEAQWPVVFRDTRLGIMICEDIWFSDVAEHLKNAGAEIFLTLHGSPFYTNKYKERKEVANKIVKATNIPLVYVNLVGGQDELVFDGGSFALDTYSNSIWLPHFEEKTQEITVSIHDQAGIFSLENAYPTYCEIEEARRGLVLGIRDYVNKNRFPGVVIGLSGGADSALTAALAVDALGPDRVKGIMMPGPHSSDHSVADALALARNLGIEVIGIPINRLFDAWKDTVNPFVNHKKETITHENAQARSRGGLVLMAFSNETGFMVLSTGNKSEMSVGYATLYGDMNGGYNALKDVYKTIVFKLMRHYNKDKEIIPWNTITKPPSAELAEGQEDQDSLPPYDILDGILSGLIEDELTISAIAKQIGVEESLVRKIQNMLYSAEFKRRQSCSGPKITRRSLGKDRRYPITNRYRD